jgi:hypothetical protein
VLLNLVEMRIGILRFRCSVAGLALISANFCIWWRSESVFTITCDARIAILCWRQGNWRLACHVPLAVAKAIRNGIRQVGRCFVFHMSSVVIRRCFGANVIVTAWL